MLPLLVDLKDFITMRGVTHLGVGELSPSERKLLASDMVSASFSVASADHERFEGLVSEMLGAAGLEAVAGWKTQKEESFRRAEEFGRKELGQVAENQGQERGAAEADVWVVFVRKGDAALVQEMVGKAGSLATGGVEVQHWASV